MKRRIVVYRIQLNPQPNMRMAEALAPFYRQDQSEAFMLRTPFGMLSNFLSPATPEEIFQAALASNCGCDFIVTEIDEHDNIVKTITSTGAEITVGESSAPIDHNFVDSRMTEQELKDEFDRLLEKVHAHGINSLTKQEKARMKHLSQL